MPIHGLLAPLTSRLIGGALDAHLHVIARKTARSVGMKRYLTGKPCKYGHLSERYVITGQCIQCFEGRGSQPDRVAYQAAYRASNQDRIRQNKARYAAENTDRIRQWRLDYRERKGSAVIAAMKHARYLVTRGAVLARQRLYYQNNKARIKETQDAWRRANPGFALAAAHRRRARKLQAGGRFSFRDVEKLLLLQRERCALCRKRFPKSGAERYHVDHIIPLARGGTNWPDNLQLLCPPCNRTKSAKDPYDFAASLGRLF